MYYIIQVADNPIFGKSARGRQRLRVIISKKIAETFPGYNLRKFKTQEEALELVHKIRNFYNVTLEVLQGCDPA